MLRHAARLLVLSAALAGCASAQPRVAYVEAEPYAAPPPVVYAAPGPVGYAGRPVYAAPPVYPAAPAYAAPPVAYAHPVRPGNVYARPWGVPRRPMSPPAFAQRATPPAAVRPAPSPFVPQAPPPGIVAPGARPHFAEPAPRPSAPVYRPAPLQHPPHFATRPAPQPTRNHGWHKHAELDRSRDTAER